MENYPFGYRYKLAAYAPEMKVVIYIKSMYLDDGLSQRDIVRRLNDEKIRCRGRKWHQGTLSKIIQRECPEQERAKRVPKVKARPLKPSWRELARQRERERTQE